MLMDVANVVAELGISSIQALLQLLSDGLSYLNMTSAECLIIETATFIAFNSLRLFRKVEVSRRYTTMLAYHLSTLCSGGGF